MPKNVVLCADGTCNAFGYSSSNVARLIEFIELHKKDEQLVAYEQGIGTTLTQYERIKRFADRLGDNSALWALEPPNEKWSDPRTWPFLIASMTCGWGLKTNVRRLYATLARMYSPGDRVFLFGFSRGAFTVRALAGLTWRYGLPAPSRDPNARFSQAWPLFVNEFQDPAGGAKAKAFFDNGGCECPIHFLGLWDTVKSYGGLFPRMLPHLRHNASVHTVRHALSLNESRGWFEVTTWGWLDSDQKKDAAASRLDPDDIAKIKTQDVAEVWFTGCHADIGGGGHSDRSASIALRWLLGEANQAGLRLNAYGRWFLACPSEYESADVEDSRSRPWKVVDWLPRAGIKNDKTWPRHVYARRASPRRPQDSVRRKRVLYHESVKCLSVFKDVPSCVALERRTTQRYQRQESTSREYRGEPT
jgi:uncharacterized protein (DUF2235 family)